MHIRFSLFIQWQNTHSFVNPGPARLRHENDEMREFFLSEPREDNRQRSKKETGAPPPPQSNIMVRDSQSRFKLRLEKRSSAILKQGRIVAEIPSTSSIFPHSSLFLSINIAPSRTFTSSTQLSTPSCFGLRSLPSITLLVLRWISLLKHSGKTWVGQIWIKASSERWCVREKQGCWLKLLTNS